MSSSASYPPDGTYSTQVAYPNNTLNVPPPQPQKPRRGKKGMIAISIVVLLVILAGTAFAGFYFISHRSPTAQIGTSVTPTTAPTIPAATATTPAGTPTTPSGTATTPAGTPTTPTGTTPTSVVTTPTTGGYTAIQPGPGCDTSGGTWTPQNISGISCGTQLSVSGSTRGYLYLQLPNNKAFSTSNIIGVSANLGSGYGGYCVGLAEQGTNTGYLAEYCAGGDWFVYSISSGGAVVQTLAKSLTSTRANEQLSLTIKGSTLSFSIDTEVHNISITPIQPTRVAITFATGNYGGSNVTVTNFSYTALS